MIHIAALSGSLRQNSYNTATLEVLKTLRPGVVDMDVITLHGIPLFDEDVEAQGWPPPVQALRDRVAPADGILFATPEYNYGMTGVLKNGIDWLSRPTGKGPIVGKPAAVIGASMSKVGTARAQSQVRDCAFYNAMPLLASAEVLVSKAQNVFDEHGRLEDEDTRAFLTEMLDSFVDWIRTNKGTRAAS